jgi:hypothetical protein
MNSVSLMIIDTLNKFVLVKTLHIPRRHANIHDNQYSLFYFFPDTLLVNLVVSCPYKQCYIEGSAKCSTKPLSRLLTWAAKASLQALLWRYIHERWCESDVDSETFRRSVRVHVQSSSLSLCNSIKTLDFSTLYTTIPHSNLGKRLKELVQLRFLKENDQHKYQYLDLGKDKSYSWSKNTLILLKSSLTLTSSNAWAMLGGNDFQQTVGIMMVNNW